MTNTFLHPCDFMYFAIDGISLLSRISGGPSYAVESSLPMTMMLCWSLVDRYYAQFRRWSLGIYNLVTEFCCKVESAGTGGRARRSLVTQRLNPGLVYVTSYSTPRFWVSSIQSDQCIIRERHTDVLVFERQKCSASQSSSQEVTNPTISSWIIWICGGSSRRSLRPFSSQ